MLTGVKGPPTWPVDVSEVLGVTTRAPGGKFTVRVTGRVVLPRPSVVFVNVMVSRYVPAVSGLALLLTETVTVVDAEAASVPFTEDSFSQVCDFEAVQLRDWDPVF